MCVDIHTHFTPPRFFDEMDRLGAFLDIEAFKVYGPMLQGGARKLFAAGEAAVVEGWIEQMDFSAVDLAVLSMGAFQPYFTDPHAAEYAAGFINDMLVDATGTANGRLAAFGSIPLPHPRQAVREVQRCLDDRGMTGINVGCSAAGLPLDDPRFEEVWATLDERNATVFIHPGSTPLMGVGSGDFHLAPDFCSPAETAIAIGRLIVTGLTTRYPNIKFIAAAMGGSIPFLAHRFDRGLRQTNPELHEQLGGVLPHLKKFWYDTSLLEEPFAIESVRHSVGTDRLVFGSDLPRGPLAEAVEFITTSSHLDDAEKDSILKHNVLHALPPQDGMARLTSLDPRP